MAINGGTSPELDPDWWQRLLAQDPQRQYYSSPVGRDFFTSYFTDPDEPELGVRERVSPRKKRFFQESYSDIWSDFLGAQGTSMRAGQAPTTFGQYIQQNDPWTARYGGLSQAARGTTGYAANPRTRFLFNF